MDKARPSDSIIKIVYFDEGSATDCIQLQQGGAVEFVVREASTDSNSNDASAKGSVGGKARFLRLLHADVSATGAISSSSGTETVINSVVTNTVLTDFLDLVEEADPNPSAIRTFAKCKIEQIPGSISGMSLFTPYFSMFRGGQTIEAGDFDIALDKLDSTLSKAKGYFEFLGIPNRGKPVIFRFNGLAFKNNYRPSNLLSMNLRVYAIEVGECCLADFNAEQELALEGFKGKPNPDYTEDGDAESRPSGEKLKMYDVLLAGVSSHGK